MTNLLEVFLCSLFPFYFCLWLCLQVADSSPAKQFLFKRSLQTAHRRRMLVEAGKPVGHALELQHRLLDQVGNAALVSYPGHVKTPAECSLIGHPSLLSTAKSTAARSP